MAQLFMSTICPACGKRIPTGPRFCAYCGARTPTWPVRVLRGFDWRFLAYWFAATAAAGVAAWLLLTRQLFGRGLDQSPYLLGGIALAGLLVAASEWAVLRPRAHHARWWVAALPLTWALAFALYSIWPRLGEQQPALSASLRTLVPLGLLLVIAGYLQWPLARHYTWPAWLWALAPVAALCLAFLVIAFAPAARQAGGWFAGLALALPNSTPALTGFDLGLAALLGLLFGTAQFPLVRRSAPGVVLWPITLSLAAVVAVILLDGGLSVGAAISHAANGADPAQIWSFLADATPVGGMLAWAVLGAGLGAGQWLALRWSVLLVARLPAHVQTPALEAVDRRWVPLAAASYAVAWPAAWVLLADGWLLIGALVGGLLIGLPQWLILRRDFSQAGWLPVAGAGAYGVATALSLLPGMPTLTEPFGLALLIAVMGLAPGIALARH